MAGFQYRILLADDDEALLASTAAILSREGYVVLTARDGFEALAALQDSIPEIVVSDLKMPNMSGFELLAVVRQRFPAVGVIARSGEFFPLGTPEGVLADRFVQKGENSDFELIESIHELLPQLPLRTSHAKAEIAPAWIPRSNTNYVVITCPSCLRSSSVRMRDVGSGVVVASSCLHCGAEIKYRLDIATVSETQKPALAERLHKSAEESRRAIADSKKAIEQSKLLINEPRNDRTP